MRGGCHFRHRQATELPGDCLPAGMGRNQELIGHELSTSNQLIPSVICFSDRHVAWTWLAVCTLGSCPEHAAHLVCVRSGCCNVHMHKQDDKGALQELCGSMPMQ